MDLSDLFIIFIFVLIGILLWQNAGLRERALSLAAQHCRTQEVQLLDESIAQMGIGFYRDKRGNVSLSRRYEFEFTSTGEQRYKGRLRLSGRRLIEASLDPHRMTEGHEAAAQAPPKHNRDRSHLRGL